MERDIFTPLSFAESGRGGADDRMQRTRDLKAQQKNYVSQEVDFKKLLEESQRMNQMYMRSMAALDARTHDLSAYQQVQNGPSTSLLGMVGMNTNYQHTGRSLQQLHDMLNNETAVSTTDLSATQYANAKQWFASKGFSDQDWDMTGLKACQKLISEERQAEVAPGVKFGRLGGNRALNNRTFVEHVFESGSANNQVKLGKRLAKSHHDKMLTKL